jgi:tetraacyldisaccharide 4'-kinase
MVMRTPKFWYQPRGILSILLAPLSWLYQLGDKINQALKPNAYKSPLPVICVGNATAGGGGKTPTVIALTKILSDYNIALLTRGYGGNITEPTIVDLKAHTTAQVGDEALLLAQHATTIICRNRAEGAKMAEQNNANIIIMDDGLQNNSLHKDITFLVIDRQIDFGNNKVIPAGPLRAPLKTTLNKSDAVICIGAPLQSDLPVFESAIEPQNNIHPSTQYIAFAGLAIPDKFKNTLLDLNASLIGWYPFADHHAYTNDDIQELKDIAKEKSATLITTEKDFVRLSPEQKENIETLPIALRFKDEEAITHFIRKTIST